MTKEEWIALSKDILNQELSSAIYSDCKDSEDVEKIKDCLRRVKSLANSYTHDADYCLNIAMENKI